MALWTSLLGLSLGLSAMQQVAPSGEFRPPSGPPAPWTITENRTLVWAGTPYQPVGLRIEGSLDAIRRAKSFGIEDVAIELSASGTEWREILQELEAQKMRYMIALDSFVPLAPGVMVEPQSFRFTDITQKRKVSLRIPGMTSALTILAERSDATILRNEVVNTPDGLLEVNVDPPSDLEHVLLIYPITQLGTLVDAWEGMDRHRDQLLRSLKVSPPGPGLRGIINPAGKALRLRSTRTFVPTSSLFRMDLRMYLEQRYRALDTATLAWGMAQHDIRSFLELAQLVPLWSGGRGVGMLWNPVTGKTYTVDMRRSAIWQDLDAVLNTAMQRRFGRLVTGIRKLVDVPVLQDWAGWSVPYEASFPSLNGVSAVTRGLTPSAVAQTAGRAASSVLRWSTPGWLVAGEIDAPQGEETLAQLPGLLEDLGSMGFRGWFIRANDPSVIKLVAEQAQRRQGDISLSTWTTSAEFFPEAAANPAAVMRLPGNRWWLPTPTDGNRVDLGEGFNAYRVSSSSGPAFVLWTTGATVRVKLRVLNPKDAQFTSVGTSAEPKIVRGGVEVTLGPLPTIVTGLDEIPVPEPALNEVIRNFDALVKYGEGLRMDPQEQKIPFQDALSGFDRNPGGSFLLMRNQLNRLNNRLGRYHWVEAEQPRETNFSEVQPISGVSGGAVISLRTPFLTDPAYSARYEFITRSGDDLDVWVSMRAPADQVRLVTLEVAGQKLTAQEGPLSPYSGGFGWYRFGTTRLPSGTTRLMVRVQPVAGTDLALDAIVLATVGFRPSGIRQPDAIPFESAP